MEKYIGNIHKTSILIVDDLPQNLEAIQAVLEKLKQNLYFAKSGCEALRLILKHDFSVILLDINMPGLNGYETAKLIRSREKNTYTPIIFLSALDESEINVNEGYRIGAVDFIFKPINPVILNSKIKVFIDLFIKSSLAINLQKELMDRKEAENAKIKMKQLDLAEFQRSSAIKEITSAIAHELNQPLTTINNYLCGTINLINRKNHDLKKLKFALETSQKEALRAGKILHRIKNFSSKNSIFIESIEINYLLKNIISLLDDEIKRHKVSIIYHLSKKIKKIQVDKIQIEQVIINLIKNSIEAFHHDSNQIRKIFVMTTLSKDKKLIIRIKDNGPGICPRVISEIFNLYFTTKEKGIGIGLTICHTIIEAHRGNIQVKNNKRCGSSFIIALPTHLI